MAALSDKDLEQIKVGVLECKRKELVDKVDPTRHLPYLRGKFILNERDCDEIKGARSRQASMEIFLDILTRKGSVGYDEFCNSLIHEQTQIFLLTSLNNTLQVLRAKVIESKVELQQQAANQHVSAVRKNSHSPPLSPKTHHSPPTYPQTLPQTSPLPRPHHPCPPSQSHPHYPSSHPSPFYAHHPTYSPPQPRHYDYHSQPVHVHTQPGAARPPTNSSPPGRFQQTCEVDRHRRRSDDMPCGESLGFVPVNQSPQYKHP